ncbi:hypothetical protein D8I24_5492 (plasmid) [Cupriavidus necator H850]|nr:hypothetical protein D8I24_5492 [Cupriavidus necator H850]
MDTMVCAFDELRFSSGNARPFLRIASLGSHIARAKRISCRLDTKRLLHGVSLACL